MIVVCQGFYRDAAGVVHHAPGCAMPKGSPPGATHRSSPECLKAWRAGEVPALARAAA